MKKDELMTWLKSMTNQAVRCSSETSKVKSTNPTAKRAFIFHMGQIVQMVNEAIKELQEM